MNEICAITGKCPEFQLFHVFYLMSLAWSAVLCLGTISLDSYRRDRTYSLWRGITASLTILTLFTPTGIAIAGTLHFMLLKEAPLGATLIASGMFAVSAWLFFHSFIGPIVNKIKFQSHP